MTREKTGFHKTKQHHLPADYDKTFPTKDSTVKASYSLNKIEFPHPSFPHPTSFVKFLGTPALFQVQSKCHRFQSYSFMDKNKDFTMIYTIPRHKPVAKIG